jgi:heme A synthase
MPADVERMKMPPVATCVSCPFPVAFAIAPLFLALRVFIHEGPIPLTELRFEDGDAEWLVWYVICCLGFQAVIGVPSLWILGKAPSFAAHLVLGAVVGGSLSVGLWRWLADIEANFHVIATCFGAPVAVGYVAAYAVTASMRHG